MVNTTEGIGRLIADEVLLQTERQLLRNRDQPSQQAKEQPPQPSSPPLSHNDKAAVSSVLLTLLDEQLGASEIALKRQSADMAAVQFRNGEPPSTNRIAAQYSEAETVFRPDKAIDERPTPLGLSNPQAMASSPELRMMMESAFVSAAARLQSGVNTGADSGRKQKPGVPPDLAPIIRIGAGIFAAVVFAIVVAAIFGR